MIIGVPKEIKLQEHRIGLTPDSVKILNGKGHQVLIQDNGGFEAGFTNEDYLSAGGEIINSAEEIYKKAEIIDPNFSEFLFNKANYLFIKNQIEKAVEILKSNKNQIRFLTKLIKTI